MLDWKVLMVAFLRFQILACSWFNTAGQFLSSVGVLNCSSKILVGSYKMEKRLCYIRHPERKIVNQRCSALEIRLTLRLRLAQLLITFTDNYANCDIAKHVDWHYWRRLHTTDRVLVKLTEL